MSKLFSIIVNQPENVEWVVIANNKEQAIKKLKNRLLYSVDVNKLDVIEHDGDVGFIGRVQ
jgi:hypothetical protein